MYVQYTFVVHGVISKIRIFHPIILNIFFFGCLFDPFSLLCASNDAHYVFNDFIISPPSPLYVSEYIYLHIHVLFIKKKALNTHIYLNCSAMFQCRLIFNNNMYTCILEKEINCIARKNRKKSYEKSFDCPFMPSMITSNVKRLSNCKNCFDAF
jgi:hypothetical protein